MLIQLSLIIWLAQSGAEWKIVRSSPWAQRNFHGSRGMLISGLISAVLSVLALNVSPTFGGAFAIAGLLGMFTNELTFNLYEGIWNAWHRAKGIKAEVKTWKVSHSPMVKDATLGVKGAAVGVVGFFALVGKMIRFIGWCCTRPRAINAHFNRKAHA